MSKPTRPARLLGLDLGTSSLKAVLTDGRGAVLDVASRPYPLARPRPGWVEQAPEDWWAALVALLADLRAHGHTLDDLAAVGFSGQMHGLVLLDAHGEPLGPCALWADSRCFAETQELAERFGADRLARIAGSRPYTSATAPKLLWTRRHEPERLQAAAHVLLPKDYLRWRMTGTLATDVTDASGTLLLDVTTRAWSDELLDALEIPRDLLPAVYESSAVTGTLTPEVARALGLRAGLPVVAGAGDAEAAAIGQGLIGGPMDAGLGLATLGTAGQFFAVTETPEIAPDGALQTLCHAAPGRWHVMRCILAGASTLDWLAGLLAPEGERGLILAELLAGAEATAPGAGGLLFLPHLNGVRSPEADARIAGAYVGLRPETAPAALARATIEGVALAIREGLDAARALGLNVARMRLAGGANRYAPWARVQADVYGLPVERGETDDASALGAALLAGDGAGLLPLAESSARLAETQAEVLTPDPAAAAMYDRLARAFATLSTQLRDVFHGLAEAVG